MRLIKRNISNALYSNGRMPKGGFGSSEDVTLSLFSNGLDTYITPNARSTLCNDPSILYASLSYLLAKPETEIVIACGSFPISSGDTVTGISIFKSTKKFIYQSVIINNITNLNASFSAAGGYGNYNITGNEGRLFIEGQKSRECLLKAIPELRSPPWVEV